MKKLLIIDVRTEVRKNIAGALTFAGYACVEASDATEGMEIAAKEKPDLIICDVMIPDLDGHDALYLFSKNEATALTPFIFLHPIAEHKGLSTGTNNKMSKTFDDIDLLNTVKAELRKHDILTEQYSADEKGASMLIKTLNGSGIMDLQLDKYKKGAWLRKQLLYMEGKRPAYLFYIQKGQVKTYKINEDGKEYITNLYAAEDFAGYLPLLEDKEYDDTAEILEDAEILSIPRQDFLDALYHDMNIACRFLKLIARDIKSKEERLIQMAYSSLRKRVAGALLDITGKFSSNNSKISITREDIAQYIGTAKESAIRVLSDFKLEKLIETVKGKIKVLDKQKLQSML